MTAHTELEKLLPCPFCKSPATTFKCEDDRRGDTIGAYCTGDDCQAEQRTVAKWNTRASLDAAPADDTMICTGCGHLGDAPTGDNIISCCPERETISIRDFFRRSTLNAAPAGQVDDTLAIEFQNRERDAYYGGTQRRARFWQWCHENKERIVAALRTAKPADEGRDLALIERSIRFVGRMCDDADARAVLTLFTDEQQQREKES